MSALVQGQVVNLAVREGDKVKKGDFLLQIDRNRARRLRRPAPAPPSRASLADRGTAKETMAAGRARLRAVAAELRGADHVRGRLPARPVGSETARSAFESAQNRVDQMRAGLSADRDTLSKTTVRAPIDGVVTTLRVKAGEVTVIGTMNNPGTQLLTVSDMSTVEAVLMVDETDTPTVQVGQKTLLNIDAYPGRTFDGLVTEVGTRRS